MLSYRTTGYNGYAVKYLPFYDNKLAVAASANYGLVGNGKLYILLITPSGEITCDTQFDTQDGLFDAAWLETHENQVVVALGDGLIKLFDAGIAQFPVMQWQEHRREVFSVAWNLVEKTSFVLALWDGLVKLWSPLRPQLLHTLVPQVDFSAKAAPVPAPAVPVLNKQTTATSSNECIYQAQFLPHLPHVVVSAHANLHVMVWDLRLPRPLLLDFVAHGGMETLTVDWNKYRLTVIALAGVDKLIKLWDTRFVLNVLQPALLVTPALAMQPMPQALNYFHGHDFAVRRVQFSPHDGGMLLSCLYDMTARVWQDHTDEKRMGGLRLGAQQLRGTMHQHREFVIGGDWSMWGEPGWCATTGWDEMVYVWDSKRLGA